MTCGCLVPDCAFQEVSVPVRQGVRTAERAGVVGGDFAAGAAQVGALDSLCERLRMVFEPSLFILCFPIFAPLPGFRQDVPQELQKCFWLVPDNS